MSQIGNSQAVQWLGLHAFTAEDPGSIPGRGTKILQAEWYNQKQTPSESDIENCQKGTLK